MKDDARPGLHPRHDLGQNFLVDLNLLDLIVRHAKLSTADVVLEVGTGTGGLTMHLAPLAGQIVSVEYDDHVYQHAKAALAAQRNVTLIHGDALANKNTLNPEVIAAVERALKNARRHEHSQYGGPTDAGETDNPWQLQPADTTLKLVANLPYHVATPVMSNLVASNLPWSRMVVTVQYEMAVRMMAQPKTSDYSALTVWMQAQADLQLIRKLPPTVFWPPPKVDSAVLVVERDPERQAKIVDRGFFHEFVRDVFTQRRKLVAGVLSNLVDAANAEWTTKVTARTRPEIDAVFAELNIPADARAEQLPVNQWVALANRLVSGPVNLPSTSPS
jgi:16S rRNA (adenine1518-N6/adenine1519-N6)-dimethyltransferase